MASGACGLLYEVAWSRRLELTFGTSVHAIATVLAVYMTGLGFGAWGAGRLADRRSPLECVRLYAVLELVIGAYGLLSLPLCRAVEAVFFALAPGPTGLTSALLRAALAFLVLLGPTVLMGATLPVLTRALTAGRGDEAQRVVALLYGANTIGAVLGAGLTGFVLLEALGLWGAVACGVLGNGAVAAVAFLFRRRLAGEETTQDGAAAAPAGEPPRGPLEANARRIGAIATFGFGFVALALEVGWSRLLGLVFGSSSAGFTLTLMGVLIGIGVGSVLSRRPAATASAVRRLVVLGLAVGLGSNALLAGWPYLSRWLARVLAEETSLGGFVALQLTVGCGLLLPATLAFGAAFPLAARLGISGHEVGRGVGSVYLWNTLGALLGAGPASVIGLELLGLRSYLYLLAWLGVVGAGLLAAHAYRAGALSLRALSGVAAAVLGVGVLGLVRPSWAQEAIDLGPVVQRTRTSGPVELERRLRQAGARLVHLRDGASATVTVRESRYNRYLTINGKVDASTGRDMPTQILLGALPLLARPTAERALLVGLGSGVSAATLADFGLERVEVAELEPAVAEAARFFAPWTGDLERANLEVIVADGRTVLATSEERYDLVVSQPTNPWVAGVASLFTREFYALVRSRLAPGGVACQWIQLYLSDPWMARSQLRTFAASFPHVQLWYANPGDLLLLGSEAPLEIDLERARAAFRDHALLAREGRRLAFAEVDDLLGRYVCDGEALLAFAAGGELLSDLHPRLEGAALRNLLLRRDSGLGGPLLDLRDRAAPFPPLRGSFDADRARRTFAELLALASPARALRELEALSTQGPRELLLRARALAASGRRADARRSLAELAAHDPAAAVLAAELALADRDPDGARAALAPFAGGAALREDAVYHYLATKLAASPREALAHALAGLASFDPIDEALEVEEWLVAVAVDAGLAVGETAAVEAALAGHLQRWPHDWLYAAALAKLWSDTGRAERAVALFARVEREARLVADWIWLGHAAALLQLGRRDEAHEWIERARELFPERVEPYARALRERFGE